MKDEISSVLGPLSRRQFLTAMGISAALAAAGGSALEPMVAEAAPLGSGTVKFWDGVLGSGLFNQVSKQAVSGWKNGGYKANYQEVTGNLFEVFQAALAAGTGPAVSGGYAFQAFQFANEGAIHYADKVVAKMKQKGIYNDYLNGLFTPFKTKKGYVALPWGMDVRVMWYNKALLEQAGASVPTDWDSFLAAGKALKKIGVYGFATAAGSQSAYGGHALVSMMINNGGGLFDEEGNPAATYQRNVEAMDFVREMIAAGMVDPASVSYTNTNLYQLFATKKAAMGIVNATLPQEAGFDSATGDLVVMSPIKGPHGDHGTLEYLKNYMMYTNNPNNAATEAFMLWWLQRFVGESGLFSKGSPGSVPARKSELKLQGIASDPNMVKIVKEVEPVAKGYSARSKTLFAGLAAVDAGTAVNQFTQQMLSGKTDSKTALQTLQNGIKSALS